MKRDGLFNKRNLIISDLLLWMSYPFQVDFPVKNKTTKLISSKNDASARTNYFQAENKITYRTLISRFMLNTIFYKL